MVNDQFGSPTSTREVCRQVLRALPTELRGVFHATCEGWCTWFDFAKEIVTVDIPECKIRYHSASPVRPCSTTEFPRPAPRPKNSRLENQRLKNAGLSVMTDWKSAFAEFRRDEAALREE